MPIMTLRIVLDTRPRKREYALGLGTIRGFRPTGCDGIEGARERQRIRGVT